MNLSTPFINVLLQILNFEGLDSHERKRADQDI